MEILAWTPFLHGNPFDMATAAGPLPKSLRVIVGSHELERCRPVTRTPVNHGKL